MKTSLFPLERGTVKLDEQPIYILPNGTRYCFRLCHHILSENSNKYSVSSVGELVVDGKLEEVALGAKYQTMVFFVDTKNKERREIDSFDSNELDDVIKAHHNFIQKYLKM